MNEVNESEGPKPTGGYQRWTLPFPDWQKDGATRWEKARLGQSVLDTVSAAQPIWMKREIGGSWVKSSFNYLIVGLKHRTSI